MSTPHDDDGFLKLPSTEDLQRLKGEEPRPEYGKKDRTRGEWVGPRRPASKAADRQYVPAAIRHWRSVHGLTQRQASARIGLSPKSNSWALWEVGQRAPSYEMLLKIIAASGLGHWVDAARALDVDPTLRLEVMKARLEQQDAHKSD